MPEHVSCIIWRRFSKAVKYAVMSGDALHRYRTGGPHPAPLMYQSPGTFRTPPKLSLGILKCAISGASPLCGYISAFNKLKKIRTRRDDVRLCAVRSHARANEFNASRPITST